MKKISTLFLIFHVFVLFAQENNFSRSIDVAMDTDYGKEIHNFDGGFLILSGSFCDNNTIPCAGLTKVDEFGNIEWKKAYRDIDLGSPSHISVRNDTFYVFARSNEHIAYSPTLKITSFNKYGDSIKVMHIQRDSFEYERSIAVDDHGILIGSQKLDNSNIAGDFRLRMYNHQGQLQWEKRLGDTNPVSSSGCRKIISTKDGNYVITAFNRPYHATSSFRTTHQIYKINPQGTILWQHTQDTVRIKGTGTSTARIVETPDGGFVTYQQYDRRSADEDSLYLLENPPIIYKLNSQGEEVWRTIIYGHINHEIFDIVVNKNGNIFAVGTDADAFYRFIRGETKYHLDWEVIYDAFVGGWLAGFSPDGELNFHHTFLDTSITKTGFAAFYNVATTSDGDLIITGDIRDTKSGLSQIAEGNTWLVRVDSNGCFSPACRKLTLDMDETVSTTQPIKNIQTIQLRPNPVVSDLIVDLDQSGVTNKYSDWTIINLHGQKVATGTNRSSDIQLSIDVSDLANGTYFLQLFNEEGAVVAMGRFVKM